MSNSFKMTLLLSCVVLVSLCLSSCSNSEKRKQEAQEVMEKIKREAQQRRFIAMLGAYTFYEEGYEYRVVLNADKTAQLIPEKGAKISPLEGDIAYGSWDDYSVGIDAEFKVKEIITDPFSVGKWSVNVHRYSCYFREGYVYHSYDEAEAKDPTHRVPYTKTN